jgi:hypothetical protein
MRNHEYDQLEEEEEEENYEQKFQDAISVETIFIQRRN